MLPPLHQHQHQNTKSVLFPQEPDDDENNSMMKQNQIIRNARLRSLGAKFSQMDALVIQFEAETQLVKSQIQNVISSAKRDLNLLLISDENSFEKG